MRTIKNEAGDRSSSNTITNDRHYLSLMESVVIDIWGRVSGGKKEVGDEEEEGERSYGAASGYENTLNTYHD